jgi:hypothetical protein
MSGEVGKYLDASDSKDEIGLGQQLSTAEFQLSNLSAFNSD